MKLIVIVKDLDLIAENEHKVFGDILEVDDKRAAELLEYRFNEIPVVIPVQDSDADLIEENKTLKEKIEELENTNTILVEENKMLKEKTEELNETPAEDKKSQSKSGKDDK